MKRILILSVLFFVASFFIATQSALAGGDKVRGDESEGPSYQLGECPFIG